jgi:hypothetical protein
MKGNKEWQTTIIKKRDSYAIYQMEGYFSDRTVLYSTVVVVVVMEVVVMLSSLPGTFPT